MNKDPGSLAQKVPFRRINSLLIVLVVVPALNIMVDKNAHLEIAGVGFHLSDLAFFSIALLAAFASVSIVAIRRLQQGLPRWSWRHELGLWLAVLALAWVVLPGFGFEYQRYSDTDDTIYKFRKRFILEALAHPWESRDQLSWLQSNDNRDLIPADVFCRERELRTRLLFEYELMNFPAQHVPVLDGPNFDVLDPEALKTIIGNCRREGPAMLKAGLTPESALLAGDLDRFVALSEQAEGGLPEVMLSVDALPLEMRKAMQAYFATHAEDEQDNPSRRFSGDKLLCALYATDPDTRKFLAAHPDPIEKLAPEQFPAAMRRVQRLYVHRELGYRDEPDIPTAADAEQYCRYSN